MSNSSGDSPSSSSSPFAFLYDVLLSPSDLVGKWMAVVALAISIAVGAFTIVDHTLTEPSKRELSELSKLRDIVLEIGKANATSMILMNDIGGLSAARQMNSIKFPLLASAVNIVDRNRDTVEAHFLLVLVGELMQIQNYAVALEYATLAREVAKLQDTRVEATRLMAVATMGACGEYDCPRALALFEQSLEEAKGVDNYNGPWLVSNVLRDWAIEAMHMGQCEEASKILGRFATHVPLPIGRAPARLGFHAVLERAKFTQICSDEEIEEHIDESYFADVIEQVFESY